MHNSSGKVRAFAPILHDRLKKVHPGNLVQTLLRPAKDSAEHQ
jgi:hypothetical protein